MKYDFSIRAALLSALCGAVFVFEAPFPSQANSAATVTETSSTYMPTRWVSGHEQDQLADEMLRSQIGKGNARAPVNELRESCNKPYVAQMYPQFTAPVTGGYLAGEYVTEAAGAQTPPDKTKKTTH